MVVDVLVKTHHIALRPIIDSSFGSIQESLGNIKVLVAGSTVESEGRTGILVHVGHVSDVKRISIREIKDGS